MDMSNASLLLRFRLRLLFLNLKHRILVAAQILWPIVPIGLRYKGSAAACVCSTATTSGGAAATYIAGIRRIHLARGRTKRVGSNNLGTVVACRMSRRPRLPVVPIQRFQWTGFASFA